MSDHTKDIEQLLRWLDAYDKSIPQSQHRWHAALTALVAERDALRKNTTELESELTAYAQLVSDLIAEKWRLQDRIKELEAQPPAASDLRERLLESALRGVNVSGLHRSEAELIGKASVWMVDAAIDAMRKGEA